MTIDSRLNNGITMPARAHPTKPPPQSRPRSTPATGRSTPRARTSTTSRSAKGYAARALTAAKCSSRPRSGCPTSAKATLQAFDKGARKLGVEQLDLLILHRPAPDRFEKTIAAYKALKALLANGDQWSYAIRDRVTGALVLRLCQIAAVIARIRWASRGPVRPGRSRLYEPAVFVVRAHGEGQPSQAGTLRPPVMRRRCARRPQRGPQHRGPRRTRLGCRQPASCGGHLWYSSCKSGPSELA
jgi:hypothetical protein